MSIIKKIKRLAGVPDISQKKITEFLRSVTDVSSGFYAPKSLQSLTLVVPCYGHAQFLAIMLQSIVCQTRTPDEVIFVDDCSPDDSGNVLERLIVGMVGFPRYRIIRNEYNVGQAASLNRAIDAANSDFIMILNDDDYLMHDAIEVMGMLFDRYRDLALIGGSSIHFVNDAELARADKSISLITDIDNIPLDIRYPTDVLTYKHYNDLNMTHSGCCFRKIAWDAAGKYYSAHSKRIVPFSDRDFQLRVNALFTVGVSVSVPFSFWRSNSSVDRRKNS